MQSHDFRGLLTVVNARGRFVLYASCRSYDLGVSTTDEITLYIDGQNAGTRRPGDFIELPKAASRWEIVAGDPAQYGQLIIGDGKSGTARMVGNVRVIDAGLEATNRGFEYFGSVSLGAIVGRAGMCGILAGARAVAIKGLTVWQNAAGSVRITAASGAPTNIPGLGAGLLNKRIGFPESLALAATGQATLVVPPPPDLPVPNWFVQNIPVDGVNEAGVKFTAPFIIQPGMWFGAVGSAPNVQVRIAFEFSEIA